LTLCLRSAFTTFTGAPADSVTYIWSNPEGLSCADCPNPIVNPYVNQVYEVTVLNTSDIGNPRPCKASALGYVYVGNEPPVYVPNAFTPNGDGVNDVFLVYGSEIKHINMQIYDRIGKNYSKAITNCKVGMVPIKAPCCSPAFMLISLPSNFSMAKHWKKV
jgi:hypothetical protein